MRAGGNKKKLTLGRTIVRQAAKDKRKAKQGSTGFHIADMSQSNNPLQSVTEANSLEEFMAAASLAEREFTAEKVNISFVPEDATAIAAKQYGRGGVSYSTASLHSSSSSSLRDTVSGTVHNIQIPRRPRWTEGTSKEELHRAEKDAFLAWRRGVAIEEIRRGGGITGPTEGVQAASVTPFEKNIEVWRQLWRVVERADVLIQIVDARNPLMYYCEDVDVYAREVNPLKRTLLLINKADYLSPKQRMGWARYFSNKGIDFAFFSAKREGERLEALDRIQRGVYNNDELPQVDEEDEAEENDNDENDDENSHGEEGEDGDDSLVNPTVVSKHTNVTNKSLASMIARQQREAQRKRNAALSAAITRALAFADDSSTDTDSDDNDDDTKEKEEKGTSNAENQPAGSFSSATPSTLPSTEETKVVQIAESSSTTEKSVPHPSSAPPTAHNETRSTTTNTTAAPAPQISPIELLFQQQRQADYAGLDPADPLYAACKVYTRDELMDMFTDKYASLPRQRFGTGDEAARKRRAEMLARKREEARAARKEELRRRHEQIQRMVEVGLGAHVRFGDEDDARALDAEDEEEDLLNFDEAEEIPPLMIGMVGYPNVGKSSTINALLGATAMNHGAKRVAVASTPGKTKHFQTLTLTDDITLCDCPGLVFPTFISTKEEMVVNGVLPIDQLRDHTSPMRLVCQRIPRSYFEEYYGIKLPIPSGPGESLYRQPTVAELLDTFCKARGFMASTHAGPDHPRASRIILKDYCEGRLVYCHPPPGGWTVLNTIHTTTTTEKKSTGVKDRVSMADNVLLPSAQRSVRSMGGNVGNTTEGSGKTVTIMEISKNTNTANGGTLGTDEPPKTNKDDDDEGEESEEEEEDNGNDSDSIDEAELLAFSRVVVVKKTNELPPKETSTRSAVQEEDEDEEEEDDDEENEDQSSRYHQSTTNTDNQSSSVGRTVRQPRIKGLGRHGRVKKGARPSDPYGTEAAADAAMRKYIAAEVAAVTAGPANTTNTAVVANDSHTRTTQPTIAPPPLPLTKNTRRLASGVTIVDAVPANVRTQNLQQSRPTLSTKPGQGSSSQPGNTVVNGLQPNMLRKTLKVDV